jgi:mannosyltransferase
MRGRWLLYVILAAAAIVYFAAVGHWSLSSSEAYSALAADQHSLAAVIESAGRFDPGKPGLYQVLLHAVSGCLGDSEMVLRSPSAIFALASIVFVFLIGEEMFGFEDGLAGATLWAFNPLIVILARWARPYAMFVALALGQLLAFLKLRERPSRRRLAACTVLTAAMLYTHLGGFLWIGAEVATLVRDIYRKRRNGAAWLSLMLGVLTFMPCLPYLTHQSNELLFGHFLDYMGSPQAHSWLIESAAVAAACAIALALIFGRSLEGEGHEPARTCVICAALPIVGVAVCSALFHPVFSVRYIAPCFGLMAVLAARCLGAAGARVRNLASAAVAMMFLLMAPFYLSCNPEPWREIAQTVSDHAKPSEPIFFEVNIVDNTPGRANGDFPQGFLRVPFDRYFVGTNPQRILPDFNPAEARAVAAREADHGSGAWLISGRKPEEVRTELPTAGFRITPVFHRGIITVYHIAGIAAGRTVDRAERSNGQTAEGTSVY